MKIKPTNEWYRLSQHHGKYENYNRPHNSPWKQSIHDQLQDQPNAEHNFKVWITLLTLSLPSSKSTFSQPFKREMYSKNCLYNHLSSVKAVKTQVLHTVLCYISGEAAGEIWNWSLLGVKGLSTCANYQSGDRTETRSLAGPWGN